MTTALKAHLTRHPTHVVACLDFKNAFGSTDRTTCIKVLRELCPQNPAWLDTVNVLLSEPVLVVNPARNHLAMTYDGLRRGDPLSTLVFSLFMTEVLHKAVKTTTSEVMTLSYIDDTVLVGPADDIAQILQDLPGALAGTGLSLQPPKNTMVTKSLLRHIQAQMKDPRGLIILGEALGEDPTDPYPMGNEAFILDHLRDVTKTVVSDLSKIAVLPDKLEGDTAGLQVSWALISKTLPPRVVHLFRAHPVEQTQKMCDTLQDALIDTVRQLMGQPGFTADQLQLAKLPVTAGGLGLPDLPTLALVARTSCIATLPRADRTDSFRKDLVNQEGGMLLERLRNLSEGHPTQMAGDLSDPPPGLSLRHLSRKLTKSIQSRAISDLWIGDALRHQWIRSLPGDAPARPDSYHGHGEWLHCLRQVRDHSPGPCIQVRVKSSTGFCDANTFLIPMDGMLHAAPRGFTPDDTTASATSSPNLPGKQALQLPLSKPCSYLTRFKKMGNLPRAVSGPSTELMYTSLNRRAPSSG